MKESNNILFCFLYSDNYKAYHNICMQFYDKKVNKNLFGYEKFMETVGIDTINEATKNKNKIYEADGRFYNLLGWRYTAKLKDMPFFVLKDDFSSIAYSGFANNFVNKTTNTNSFEVEDIAVEKMVKLTSKLLQQLNDGKFTNKQISVQFYKIARKFKITHFLNLPIEEFECINNAKNLNKQKRNYHNNRFKTILAENLNSAIFKKYPKSEGIEFYRKGEVYRQPAKNLEKIDLKKDILSLFKCFLNYLTASFYYKEALKFEPNLFLAKYNYAFIIKRLGFINEAIVELNSFKLETLTNNEKFIVLENLGDCFSMIAKNKICLNNNKNEIQYFIEESINFFEEAYKINDSDSQIIFNLMETYYLQDLNKSEKTNKGKIEKYFEKINESKICQNQKVKETLNNITAFYKTELVNANKKSIMKNIKILAAVIIAFAFFSTNINLKNTTISKTSSSLKFNKTFVCDNTTKIDRPAEEEKDGDNV